MTEQEAVSRIMGQKNDQRYGAGTALPDARRMKILCTFLRSKGFHDLAKELEI